MPNHITNRITVVDLGGASISDVHGVLLNETRHVDFNRVFATPECLKDFNPSMHILDVAKQKLGLELHSNPLIAALEADNRARSLEKCEQMTPEEKAQVQRCIDNYNQCGYMYWYDCNNASWGTKWNAYSQPENGFGEDATEFEFETAWSHPYPVVELLSRKLPSVTFDVKYADEDTGSNCGSYTVKGGMFTNQDIAPPWSKQTPEQKRKYTEFAFNLRHPGEKPAEWGFDENWVYSTEVYEANNK